MANESIPFICPKCGAVSFNENDLREGYCGRCHDWTGTKASDLIPLRDSFIGHDMKSVAKEEQPTDDDVFLIAAGPWPSQFAGARRTTCQVCKKYVGISPKGWGLHERNTQRQIVCGECFSTLNNLAQRMGMVKP